MQVSVLVFFLIFFIAASKMAPPSLLFHMQWVNKAAKAYYEQRFRSTIHSTFTVQW